MRVDLVAIDLVRINLVKGSRGGIGPNCVFLVHKSRTAWGPILTWRENLLLPPAPE